LESQYAAAITGIRSLEHQMRATEQVLEQALGKVCSPKRKLTEAAYYKSLVHRLRKHWYLGLFISPVNSSLSDFRTSGRDI
jgi:hypothetical protein